MPPLPTGRVPVTSPEFKFTAEEESSPPAATWTIPAPKLLNVIAPVAFSVPATAKVASGVVVLIPTLAAEVTYKAGTEEAVTENGFKLEPFAVVRLNRVPVPVLLVESFKVKRLEFPVLFPQVKVVVVVAMESARLPVGLEIPDHAALVPVPQDWSVLLHKILTDPPSTILNLPAVES